MQHCERLDLPGWQHAALLSANEYCVLFAVRIGHLEAQPHYACHSVKRPHLQTWFIRNLWSDRVHTETLYAH